MFNHIDPRLPTPLFAQIAQAVRAAIARGDLVAGDGLPSVRALASQLRINPATVVQAYRDLEGEQLIEMRQGAGSFVRDVQPERRLRERTAEFRRSVRQVLEGGVRLGLDAGQIREVVDDELTRTRP